MIGAVYREYLLNRTKFDQGAFFDRSIDGTNEFKAHITMRGCFYKTKISN